MDTITKKRKRIVHTKRAYYNAHLPKREFIREEERQGVGVVAVYSDRDIYFPDGYTVVVKPTKNYNICARLIDHIFAEKVYKKKALITKQNIIKHVA